MLVLSCSQSTFCLFDDWKLAVIIYNAKIVLTVQRKHICSNYFPESAQCLIINDSFFGLLLLKIKTCRTTVYIIFNINIYVTQ